MLWDVSCFLFHVSSEMFWDLNPELKEKDRTFWSGAARALLGLCLMGPLVALAKPSSYAEGAVRAGSVGVVRTAAGTEVPFSSQWQKLEWQVKPSDLRQQVSWVWLRIHCCHPSPSLWDNSTPLLDLRPSTVFLKMQNPYLNLQVLHSLTPACFPRVILSLVSTSQHPVASFYSSDILLTENLCYSLGLEHSLLLIQCSFVLHSESSDW